MNVPDIQDIPQNFADVHVAEDESIRALLFGIARSLVPKGVTLSVEIFNEGETSVVRVIIDSEHLGRLIGEQGRIVKSIRTILTAAAMTFQRRYTLDIADGRLKGLGYQPTKAGAKQTTLQSATVFGDSTDALRRPLKCESAPA